MQSFIALSRVSFSAFLFRAKPKLTGLLFHKRAVGNDCALVVHKLECYRALLIVLMMVLIRGLPQMLV